MKDSSHLIKGKKGTKKKKAMGTGHQDTEESHVAPVSLPPLFACSLAQPTHFSVHTQQVLMGS